MKRALLVVCLAACTHAGGSPKTRSRTSCEKLLRHSLEAEKQLALISLDDHKYTARKVERSYDAAFDEIRNEPGFMDRCHTIANDEFDCMMRAKDPYSIEACKKQQPAVANTEPSDVQAWPDPNACPAADTKGAGMLEGTLTQGDGKPYAGVSVIIETTDNRQWTLTTDDSGYYSLKDAPAGQYVLMLLMDKTVTKQCVVVSAGKTTRVDERG